MKPKTKKPKKLSLSEQLAFAQDAYAAAQGNFVRAKGEIQKLVETNDVLRGENSSLRRQVTAANDTIEALKAPEPEGQWHVEYVTETKPWWKFWGKA